MPSYETGCPGYQRRLHSIVFLSKRPSHQLKRIAGFCIDPQRRGRLESTVHHAMVAARIVAGSVVLPLSLGHQFLEGLVMAVGDEITGALPAFHVVCRVAPSRAGIIAFTLQELEIGGRAV